MGKRRAGGGRRRSTSAPPIGPRVNIVMLSLLWGGNPRENPLPAEGKHRRTGPEVSPDWSSRGTSARTPLPWTSVSSTVNGHDLISCPRAPGTSVNAHSCRGTSCLCLPGRPCPGCGSPVFFWGAPFPHPHGLSSPGPCTPSRPPLQALGLEKEPLQRVTSSQ